MGNYAPQTPLSQRTDCWSTGIDWLLFFFPSNDLLYSDLVLF